MWGVLCDRIIVEAETNTQSYIGIIENKAAKKLPLRMPDAWVATVWESEEDDATIELRFQIERPNGKTLGEMVIPRQDMGNNRMRMNLNIRNALIKDAGVHTVIIQQKRNNRWKTEAKLPFDIHLEPDGDEA